jgi:hypothetical protein
MLRMAMDGNVDASRDVFGESCPDDEVSISKQIRVLQPTPDDAVSMGVDQLTCHVSRAWDTAKLDTYLFESVLIFRSRRTALVLQTWEHCKLAWNSERTISSGKNI